MACLVKKNHSGLPLSTIVTKAKYSFLKDNSGILFAQFVFILLKDGCYSGHFAFIVSE